MKNHRKLLLAISLAMGAVFSAALFIHVKTRLISMIFDTAITYEGDCKQGNNGNLLLGDGFYESRYKASFREQLVVMEGALPVRFRNCTVVDARQWRCALGGSIAGIKMQAGLIETRCKEDGSACTIAISPTEFFLRRILHPFDPGLENHSSAICKSRMRDIEAELWAMRETQKAMGKP